MGYRARLAKRSEREDLYALDRECFPEDEPAARLGVWWLAEHVPTGALAGFTYCAPWCFRDERALIVYRQGVRPEHYGHGLQRRFLREAAKYARRLGMHEIWSYTVGWNVISANNFIRQGFELWHPSSWDGVEDVLVSEGESWLYWRKDLRRGR